MRLYFNLILKDHKNLSETLHFFKGIGHEDYKKQGQLFIDLILSNPVISFSITAVRGPLFGT